MVANLEEEIVLNNIEGIKVIHIADPKIWDKGFLVFYLWITSIYVMIHNTDNYQKNSQILCIIKKKVRITNIPLSWIRIGERTSSHPWIETGERSSSHYAGGIPQTCDPITSKCLHQYVHMPL